MMDLQIHETFDKKPGKLYRWQEECLKIWEQNEYRGIVSAVTGAGKSRLAMAAIVRMRKIWPSLYVKVVVPTIPLAGQWMHALIQEALCEEERPGLIGGGYHEQDSRRIQIYIINSARKKLASSVRAELAQGRQVLLICDECHHYLSKENKGIFDFLNTGHMISAEWFSGKYASLGLSATPFSEEQQEFPFQALGKVIYQYRFSQAVCENVVSPCILCNISVSFIHEEKRNYDELSEQIRVVLGRLYQKYRYLKNADLSKQAFLREINRLAASTEMDPYDPATKFLLLTYQRKQICVLAQARIRCCVDLIDRLKPCDRILVFTEQISQAEDVAFQLRREFGAGVGIYHSKMTKESRRRVLDGFRNHFYRILVTCRCLDEGLDVPDANIAIVMSGSSVPRQRIQRLGRVLRKAEGKDAACLYYLYIREASEDNVYLQTEIPDHQIFDLRYHAEEREFENELYLYAVRQIMEQCRVLGRPEKQLRELRRCALEGLVRHDYLLPDSQIGEKNISAKTQHERNYWLTAQRLGRIMLEK